MTKVESMTADQMVALIFAEANRGRRWGWNDRRSINGTIRVLTGPFRGQVFANPKPGYTEAQVDAAFEDGAWL